MNRHRFGKLAFAAILAAACTLIWSGGNAAAQGDPDNDGLASLQEKLVGSQPLLADSDGDGLLDGWEWDIIGFADADPNSADSDSDGTLDCFEDIDGGGLPDGMELVNGADPWDASDDAGMMDFLIRTVSPMTSAGGVKAELPKGSKHPVFTWNADLADFMKFYVEFDDSPHFENPLRVKVKGSLKTDAQRFWARITALGRLVYWRVAGINSNRDVVYSNIASFLISKGPLPTSPADNSATPAGTKATFTWSATGFEGYRLIFRGMHQPGGSPILLPSAANWLPDWKRKKTPSDEIWKSITSLGNEVVWQVAGKTALGKVAFSQPQVLKLTGGAANLAVVSAGAPPTFVADAAKDIDAGYQIFFSSAEDFGGGSQAYNMDLANGRLSYTPTVSEWKGIKALGADFFWTVRGSVAGAYYTFSEIKEFDAGTSFTIDDQHGSLEESAVNKVTVVSPRFALKSADTVKEVVFGADPRLAGTVAVSPLVGASAANWTITAETADKIALLERQYVYMRAKALDVSGNPLFSPTYLMRSSFLAAPGMLPTQPPGKVDKNIAYKVLWTPVNAIAGYQLEEATDKNFTKKLQRYFIAPGVTEHAFRHREVSGEVAFYYRVRAVNAIGHSLWSNLVRKTVSGIPRPIYVPTSGYQENTPFERAPRQIILDDIQSNNYQGTVAFEGPGWAVMPGLGKGYMNAYHYITRSTQNYRERATYTPNIPRDGLYEVWISFFCTANASDETQYYLTHADGMTYFVVRQNVNGFDTTWVKLGTYPFKEGRAQNIYLVNGGGLFDSERTDAAGFRYVGPLPALP